MGVLLEEMTEESNDSIGVPPSFQTGQGFPTGSESEEEEEESGYPYPYEPQEPERVTHLFRQPEVPDAPETREELEKAFPQYVKWVLKEYNLEIEWGRLILKVDGRFRRALGKCQSNGYRQALIRVSSHHYIEKGYPWERCKETIRHELAHAWQIRWLGYSSHGPTFIKKAEELDCDKLARYHNEGEPKYVAHCQGCGRHYTRKRACKATKDPYSRCSQCGMSGDDIDSIEEDHVWVVWENNTEWEKVTR